MIRLGTEINDYHNSLISNIAHYSFEVAVEHMSKAGHYVKEGVRDSLSKHTHHWFRTSHHGLAFDPNRTAKLGEMNAPSGDISAPGNLMNFINSIVMERNRQKPVVVVGGSHPTDNKVIMRKDGKRIGFTKVKGVGVASTALINRIDRGEYSPDYIRYFGENEVIQNPKAYNFKMQGYASALAKVNSTLGEGWQKSMGTAMNRTQLKAERVVLHA